MDMIYKRISKFNGHPIPLSDVYTPELDDKITTIVSSLFLAYNRKINIWQHKFPFGKIFVKNLHNDDLPEELEVEVGDNGGNGGTGESGGNGKDKVLISDLDLKKTNKKKKKKLKDEMEEFVSSQKYIAS
jgi:hypothetical protein